MPRGGRRLGAGRKPGKATKTSREVADKLAPKLAINGNSPLEFLLSVMQNEQADTALRLEAARCSAPYLHGRAAPLEPVHKGFFGDNKDGAKDFDLVQILAIPRGSVIDKSGLVTINGTVVSELSPIEPFTPTPALTDQTEQPAPARFEVEELERLPVIEVEPPQNVTRLDTFKNRRDDDDPAGAA